MGVFTLSTCMHNYVHVYYTRTRLAVGYVCSYILYAPPAELIVYHINTVQGA